MKNTSHNREQSESLIKSLIDTKVLGVDKDTVRMVDYSPSWKAVFENEKSALFDACSSDIIEIFHIGSTSVAGLMAKPVIDIMAGTRSVEACEKCIEVIESLGFTYLPERFDSSWFYFEKYVGNMCIAHLHLMETSNPNYKHHLDFITILKKHIEIAKQYQNLKIKLSRKHSKNSMIYCSHKADFIKSTLKKYK